MQPPPPPAGPPQGWRPYEGGYGGGYVAPRGTETKAVVSLVLGIASLLGAMCWLGVPLGVPAIIVGALALRDVKRSEGMLGGTGMAIAGIVTGSLATLAFVATAITTIVMIFAARTALSSMPTPVAPAPVMVPTVTPDAGPPPTPSAPSPPGGWGSIDAVVLHADAGPLRAQLAAQARETRGHEVLLVETSTSPCGPCDEIARAMGAKAVQASLTRVRLLQVDAQEFASDLAGLGMSEPTAPWFFLVDASGAPKSGISADEWGDNDAKSIAPVLKAFVHGAYRPKHPWKAGASL